MKIPNEERALVLQGGGSLGAYEAGAVKAASLFLKYRNMEKDKDGKIFDIVAGTSIGAINAAILVSYVIENKTWDGAADRLIEFWNYISSETMTDKFAKPMIKWWDYWGQFFKDTASGEAARRYYSALEFEIFGVPKVFSQPHITPDTKFFDWSKKWYRYNNQHLRESLEKFAKFPIATSCDENQPRLILTSVDVLDGKVVVFDSYAKEDGTHKTEYGRYVVDNQGSLDKKDDAGIGFEHIIRYPKGITADHVLASATVPVNYDYVLLDAESYNFKTKNYEKKTRYFWDGGLLANTPLGELILHHRQFWYKIKGLKDSLPRLGLVLINLHPSRIDAVPWDFDGATNRNNDITFADRSKHDENIILLLSDFADLCKKLIEIAKSHGEKLDDLLDTLPESYGKLHDKKSLTYRDMIEGQFNIGEVIRIERENTENDTSKKVFDFSSNTIKQLLQNGYDDTAKYINANFGQKYLKDLCIQ